MKNASLSLAIIAILGLAVYANSMNGAFIWDDDHLVRDDIYIRTPNALHLFS